VIRPVIFTPEAQDDLLGLFDYIASHDGSTRALRYIARIEKTCNSLQTLPERGTRRGDLRPGLRVMGFAHRVLIAFQVSEESVAILSILYGGRSAELAFPSHRI
jgi:toxin ParE1/3/4